MKVQFKDYIFIKILVFVIISILIFANNNGFINDLILLVFLISGFEVFLSLPYFKDKLKEDKGK